MKKTVTFILFSIFALSAKAQLEYVDLDYIIDRTIIMPDNEVDTLEIDFDNNGTIDMRISSWSNHTVGLETAIEVLMPNAGIQGLQTSLTCNYLVACNVTPNYNHSMGYIYTSNCGSNPHNNQYVKFPFRFEGVNGNHCGFLYVRYVGTTITIEGYGWNPTPSGNCSCASSGWLALEKPTDFGFDLDLGEFKYYNIMGQEVFEPKGLCLKVYQSGRVVQEYITEN